MSFVPDFKFDHLGVNVGCEEKAHACAAFFAAMFGMERNPAKESPDASFTEWDIEWVKSQGRGTLGHIAVATKDLPAARAYLEEKGMTFDDSSVKSFPDGRPMVVYAVEEIGGFAIHLMQK